MKRLFYAEDLRGLALAVAYGLRWELGRSWEITIRRDIEEAVRVASDPTHDWTICLVDLDFQNLRGVGQAVGLDQRDGVIIAKQLRSHDPNVPILLVTASAEEKTISRSPEIAELFTDYMPKEENISDEADDEKAKELVLRIVNRIEKHVGLK